jgi:hypothetical protein
MNIESRVDAYAWPNVSEHLDADGWATVKKLPTTSECEAVAGLFADDRHFRSHIVMAGRTNIFRFTTCFTSTHSWSALGGDSSLASSLLC